LVYLLHNNLVFTDQWNYVWSNVGCNMSYHFWEFYIWDTWLLFQLFYDVLLVISSVWKSDIIILIWILFISGILPGYGWHFIHYLLLLLMLIIPLSISSSPSDMWTFRRIVIYWRWMH
jgi:hypothetical protein